MPVDAALETLLRDQKRWSLTSDRLKKEIGRSRLAVLVLAVCGAVLETLGAQIHEFYFVTALTFGYLGAAALAVLAVIRQWKLGRERIQAWILARAASEALKKEMYLYRASAGPYSSGKNGVALLDRRDEILAKVRTIQSYAIDPKESELEVPGPLDANGYIQERINGQVKYYRQHADECTILQGRFKKAEFALAIAGALLGAASTINGKQAYGAWVAVITTIMGSVSSHVLAERYDQLATSYRATADRLNGIVARYQASNGTLDALAQQTEAALFEQNQGWIAGADDLMKQSETQPQLPKGQVQQTPIASPNP
jgi:hypothetical protein